MVVMPGLGPGIHAWDSEATVDGRDEPGHDGGEVVAGNHRLCRPPANHIARDAMTGRAKPALVTSLACMAPRGSPMMSIPFFGLFLAFALTCVGWRRVAIAAWALSLVGLLVLFRLHATDALNIVL